MVIGDIDVSKGLQYFQIILHSVNPTCNNRRGQSQRGTVEETRHYYHWYGYRINPTGQSLKLIVETSKIQSKWFQRKDYCSTTLEWTRRYSKMVSRIKHRQTVACMTQGYMIFPIRNLPHINQHKLNDKTCILFQFWHFIRLN